MEKNNEEFELNWQKHARALDKKLDLLEKDGKLTREEIAGRRLYMELAGKLGNKGVQINLDLRDGQACPHCGMVKGGMLSEIMADLPPLTDKRQDAPSLPIIDIPQEQIQYEETLKPEIKPNL